MENLTKHQLILVALLISFVTSIATGIVTVSLMEQAPEGVTQTINRVVERTVERVVTEPNKSGDVIKETIVVKEEDKIIEAIEKNAKSMVRIYKTSSSQSEANSLKTFVGLGLIISKDGDIVTDGSIVFPADFYSVVLSDAKEYDAKMSSLPKNNMIAFLKIVPKEKDKLSLSSAILTDSDKLKLGQTVISLGGKLRNSVSVGIITSFVESVGFNDVSLSPQDQSTTTPLVGNSNITKFAAVANEAIKEDTHLIKDSKGVLTEGEKLITMIETNIIPNDNTTGNPFINLSSEVVGIKVKSSNENRTATFIPINEVKKSFSETQTMAL